MRPLLASLLFAAALGLTVGFSCAHGMTVAAERLEQASAR